MSKEAIVRLNGKQLQFHQACTSNQADVKKDGVAKFNNFKDKVTRKYARSWNNTDALKLLIINTIRVLEDNNKLVGWIPGDQATNSAEIATQLSSLIKENKELRSQISQKQKSQDNTTYNGLSFGDMYKVLIRDGLDYSGLRSEYTDCFDVVAETFGDDKASILHVFWVWNRFINDKIFDPNDNEFLKYILSELESNGLVEEDPKTSRYSDNHILTKVGKDFLLRIKSERDISAAQKAVKDLKSADSYNNGFFVPYNF